MSYLATLGLAIALIIYGLHRRRRAKTPLRSDYLAKLIWVSVGLAGMLAGGVFPTLWLFISYAVRGGSLNDNLPPGFDVRFLLGVLLIGTAVSLVYAAFGYHDHIVPPDNEPDG